MFAKNEAQPPWTNWIFEVSYLYWICNSKTIKTIKIGTNQHIDLLKFLFTEDSLKIKNGLELVFSQYFSYNFLIKIFLLQNYINWPNFITGLYLLTKLFSKMRFVFHVWTFDGFMTFGYLKKQNLIISRTKRAFKVK